MATLLIDQGVVNCPMTGKTVEIRRSCLGCIHLRAIFGITSVTCNVKKEG